MLRSRGAAIVTLALLCAGGAAVFYPRPAHAQSVCGVIDVTQGQVRIRVLFAKNRAVQRYEVTKSAGTEADHDAILALTDRYGPEEVNAPPLRVLEYRDNGSGMRIPVKAVDSCGRVTAFQ